MPTRTVRTMATVSSSGYLRGFPESDVKDYFTPCNQGHLNDVDDLGSAGPALIPDTPPLIIGGGKEGVLYLLSQTAMENILTAHSRLIARAPTRCSRRRRSRPWCTMG